MVTQRRHRQAHGFRHRQARDRGRCTPWKALFMGTMQYLAPEQLDGKDIDVRADIYSLGARHV